MTWKILSHPNVLPLICASMNGNEFVMVSEWMDNGDAINYLKRVDANRLNLVIFFSPRYTSSRITDDSVVAAC